MLTFVAGIIALVYGAKLNTEDLMQTQRELGHGS